MSSDITEHNLFRPTRSKQSKADITDRIVRTIAGAEAERREVKTAMLRQARLAKEELQATKETLTKPRRVKAAAPRRARSSM